MTHTNMDLAIHVVPYHANCILPLDQFMNKHTTHVATNRKAIPSRQAACELVCIGIAGTTLLTDEAQLLADGVRHVILFARNYQSPAQLTQLTAAIRKAAGANVLISVDQEGGRVLRFCGDPFPNQPSARALATDGEQAVARWTRDTALALRACGVNMNLAPVLDVDSNPKNPVIGDRSFSHDANVVAQLGVACVRAMQSCGVAACGKHFPGHGDTDMDSHFDLPKLPHALARLEQLEFVPFRAAIQANIAAIMSAHVVFEAIDSEVPGTLSTKVITGLLRNALGFDGLILTDDLEMKAVADRFEIGDAAVRAVTAGCDTLLVCKNLDVQHQAIEALSRAIESGQIARERLAHSRRRLDKVLNLVTTA